MTYTIYFKAENGKIRYDNFEETRLQKSDTLLKNVTDTTIIQLSIL